MHITRHPKKKMTNGTPMEAMKVLTSILYIFFLKVQKHVIIQKSEMEKEQSEKERALSINQVSETLETSRRKQEKRKVPPC